MHPPHPLSGSVATGVTDEKTGRGNDVDDVLLKIDDTRSTDAADNATSLLTPTDSASTRH